jgi:hypothetical protein
MSPNHDINRHFRKSIAAKAANRALLNWHSYVPYANIRKLEEMYEKFYHYYLDHFKSFDGDKLAMYIDSNELQHDNDIHYYGHSIRSGHEPFYSVYDNSLDHDIDEHEHHPHLNLFDLIADKSSSNGQNTIKDDERTSTLLERFLSKEN